MFAVQPQLRREHVRAFDVVSLVEGEQADYSVNQITFEVPFHQAVMTEDKRKKLTKCKPGDSLVLTPKVSLLVKNRIVVASAHQLLYTHGRPSYKTLYKHGDTMNLCVRWDCDEAFDLSTLPFLFEIFIYAQHVR